MSDISASTRVFIILIHDNKRWYLASVETARREKTGDLYLRGSWNTNPARSTAHAFEIANLIRERLRRESGITTHIALAAGDSAELID